MGDKTEKAEKREADDPRSEGDRKKRAIEGDKGR